MRVRRTWRRFLGVALTTATTVALVSCSSSAPQAVSDSGVTASSTTPPSGFRATPASGNAPVAQLVSPATQQWELQPSGPLPQPTEMTVPLSSPLPAGQELTAVTWSDPSDTPEYLPATVTPDGTHARYTAAHFSFVQFFQHQLVPGAKNVLRTVLDEATGNVAANASPPRCDGEQDVRRRGLTITSTSADTVFWCLGTEGTGAVLKIVNNRRYALAVHHSGLASENPGFANLADPATSGVRPREEVRLRMDLPPGAAARIDTEFDGLTDTINTAFVAFDALTTILGYSNATKAGKLASSAGDIKKCIVGAFANDVTKAIQACLSDKALEHYLGTGAATLLGVVGAVGTIVDWTRSRLNSAGDALHKRDLYTIVVRNTATPTAPAGGGTVPAANGIAPAGSGISAPAGAAAAGGTPPPAAVAVPAPAAGRAETAGGVLATWTNYTNAGGTAGPKVGNGQTVTIACRVSGFRVADGNTAWYRIASAPWNGAYYVSADGFYNNGRTSGPLKGTPFFDAAVPTC